MTKSAEYKNSARQLEIMSGLECISESHRTYLKRGAKALETLAELELLNALVNEGQGQRKA